MMNESRFAPSYSQKPVQEQEVSFVPARRRRHPLGWWYRLSTPDAGSEVFQETVIPRSRLASILLLVIFIAIIAFIPAALTSDDLHVVPPLIGMFLMTVVAIFLNRRGNVTIVGVIIVATFDIALIYTLLSYPHFTLTQNAVPIYDLFVLSDIIAISLLPITSILYISSFHSVFMLADIFLQPHTPDLQVLLDSTGYSLMVRPLTIQLVVALVTYLWVRNTMRALERANKAEVIAKLEHEIAAQRKDLDEGIQQVLQTLVQAANGNLNARAPLAQQHVLWQVGVGLNTLLARLQRSGQSERELQQLKTELQRLIYYVQQAKYQQMPLWLAPGGTDVDVLISELMGCALYQYPPGSERR